MEGSKKEAFASDAAEIKPKRTLKIDNTKSQIKPEQKVENFRNKINEILSNENEQKKLAYRLTSAFQSRLKDKTLDSSKNAQIRDEELEVIQDLIDFVRIINSDENQEDNLGTMTMLIILCRALFEQRDRINELEYKLAETDRRLYKLEHNSFTKTQ